MIGAFLALIAAGILAPSAVGASGELDPSFGDGGRVRTPVDHISFAYAIGRQSTGKLIAAGCSAGSEPGSQAFRFTIARYTASGTLDPSFGENGVTILSFPGDTGTACIEDLAIRPDDSILLAGRALVSSGNNQDFAIAQLTPTGQLDGNFGTDGRLTLHPGNPEYHVEATAITLDPAGRAIVAGNALTDHGDSQLDVPSFAAVRIEPDGTLDTSFGDNGEVVIEMTETAPQGIAVGSRVADVVRYGDGKIVLVGSAYDDWAGDDDSQYRSRLAAARLTSGGQLDSSFSGDGTLVTPVRGLKDHAMGRAAALTPDGKLTVALSYFEHIFAESYSGPHAMVARFEQSGDLHLGFGTEGSTLVGFGSGGESTPYALDYQADGKLVVAGVADPPEHSLPRFGLARLTATGEPDPGFGTDGLIEGPPFVPGDPWPVAYAYDLLLEPSGNIVLAGFADGPFPPEPSHFALVRYLGDTPPPPPPPPPQTYVALGDSYSSGFGAGDYAPGTNRDSTTYPNNDCQRSANAFGPIVAGALEMPLVFKACQGAVTRDLLFPSNHPWAEGESAQVDHLLGLDVGLVTFSIGGNDVGFAKAIEDCIILDSKKPLGTCSSVNSLTEPVYEALKRLDTPGDNSQQVVPYDELFKKTREHTPIGVAVGYPEFFAEKGIGGLLDRCNGVKVVDQQWAVQQIKRINAIVQRNALRNGFQFVDPSPYFDGHELCSDDEWFFPALRSIVPLELHPAAFHPTPAGQQAIAEAVLDVLQDDPSPPGLSFMITDGETVSHQFSVPSGKARLTISTKWPGSDVLTSLTSPSDQTYTRSDPGSSAYHSYGPTWEQFEIADPEPGQWRVELYGADLPPSGESVNLSTKVENPPNVPPNADITSSRNGASLVLDASQSTDTDGQINSYDWYVTSPTEESTAIGPTLSLPAEVAEGRTVTLMATDDQGATDFANVILAAMSSEEAPELSMLPAALASPLSGLDRLAPSLSGIHLQIKSKKGWRNTRVIGVASKFGGAVKVIGRVRLALGLSEDASLRLQIRSSGAAEKWQRSSSLSLSAGGHRLPLAKLLRSTHSGRYRLTLTARDHAGNAQSDSLGFHLKHVYQSQLPRRNPR